MSDVTLIQGAVASVQLPAATGGTTPYTYSLQGTLQAGLSFSATTQLITGTPTATGTETLTFRVEDDVNAVVTRQFDLTVEVFTATTQTIVLGTPIFIRCLGNHCGHPVRISCLRACFCRGNWRVSPYQSILPSTPTATLI